MRPGAYYLTRVYRAPHRDVDLSAFPFNLPFVEDLELRFDHDVTFLVGENGSGKSTVLEAIADLCNLPVGGGGRNEFGDSESPHLSSELAPALRAAFQRKPKEGYFFRAEFQAHFASLLETRKADPDFAGDPYARFGGRTLHTRSHGEAFLQMFTAWMQPGIILMDEPESALSPQRQLSLLAQMSKLAKRGRTQFIIATHSPIILTFPNAQIISFDEGLRPVTLQQTSHFQITKTILDNPGSYWRHLAADDQHEP